MQTWTLGGTTVTRIEEQVKMAPLQAACTAAGKVDRARRMGQYGAYKKGVQCLRRKVATLSETDQLRYAQPLLPDRPGDLPPPNGADWTVPTCRLRYSRV